jgi:hypothetical protein
MTLHTYPVALIEYLRLAFATLLVLVPGWLVARALGQRSTSAMVVWAFACLFVAWTAVFVVHGTIWLAVGILARSRRGRAGIARCSSSARSSVG